jgi:phosphoglycolate phosphatase-like HAD superfamily hydrolase
MFRLTAAEAPLHWWDSLRLLAAEAVPVTHSNTALLTTTQTLVGPEDLEAARQTLGQVHRPLAVLAFLRKEMQEAQAVAHKAQVVAEALEPWAVTDQVQALPETAERDLRRALRDHQRLTLAAAAVLAQLQEQGAAVAVVPVEQAQELLEP